MIEYIKHIYRSLTTFKLNPFVFLLHFFKRNKQFDASVLIKKEDFFIKNFNHCLFFSEQIEISNIQDELKWNVNQWLNHNFDLLGSGWTNRNNGASAVGFLGFVIPDQSNDHATEKEHVSILSERAARLIQKKYECLDWQMDIKSGFRWNENNNSSSQSNFLDMPYGVDVKIPWELARLNYLPLLILSARYKISDPEKTLLEYKNVLCDFIANNHYKHGINWANAMEVGIRAVNILISFDLAKNLDPDKAVIDSNFQSLVFDSIFEHAEFILENSEFKAGLTNNHYYANISALLTIGMYFSKSDSGRNLINIASREVFIESKKQFLPDGGNFEASTHYHRLSAEMLLWNCIFIKGVKNKSLYQSDSELNWNNNYETLGDFDSELDQLLSKAKKALDFSSSISKNNGNIAACGDQDSGRYVKLSLQGEWKTFGHLQTLDRQIFLGNYNWGKTENLWLENDLSQQCLHALGKNLIEVDQEIIQKFPFESDLAKYLFKDDLEEIPNIKPKSKKFGDLLHRQTSTIFYPVVLNGLKKKIEWHLYPIFGIYIAKSPDFFLSINATNNHLKKYWSHGKNDKLSFELQIKDQDIIVDPGSFIYSADENIRNKFRSTKAHSTIVVKGKEQNRWPKGKRGVFNLYSESRCKFLSQIDNRITLLCEYRDLKHIRTFQIHNDHLEIIDECTSQFETHFNYLKLYSEHYGRWRKTEKES